MLKAALNIVFITTLVPLIFGFTGCGTYQMQGSNDYPDDQLATLDTKIKWDYIFVTFVDGKSRGFGLFNTYKLVPGDRVITVTGNSQSGLYSNDTDIAFEAKPGGAYKLTYENLGNRLWTATIIDKSTSERVDYEQTHPRCWNSLKGLGDLKCEHQRAHLNEKK